MIFDIRYQESVAKDDIPRLDYEWRKKIELAIENKLTTRPDIYGKPLRQSLKGYRKLRVGDWRVIFRIERNTVKIFAIGHRSLVYKIIRERI